MDSSLFTFLATNKTSGGPEFISRTLSQTDPTLTKVSSTRDDRFTMKKEGWFGFAISEHELDREAAARNISWGPNRPHFYATSLLDIFGKLPHTLKCNLRDFEKDGQQFICFALASDAPNCGLPRDPPPSDSQGYKNLRSLLGKERVAKWHEMDPEPEQPTLSR